MLVKVFTRGSLIRANEVAIRTDRNRQLERKYLRKLDPGHLYPVTFSMLHNDVEMRVSIMFNGEGDIGWLDIPLKAFSSLPEVEIPVEVPVEA